jgi:hypothetical protein
MNAPNDNTAPKGLGGWWASPPRTGIRRTILPWEYRHLRASGVTRTAAGVLLAVGGVLFLSYGPTDGQPCSWLLEGAEGA